MKIYIYLVIIGILAGAGYGAYYYYTDTQERIELLVADKATLNGVVTAQTATLGQIEIDREARNLLLNELQQDLLSKEKSISRLRTILADHDLTALSLAKPGLIENRINNATQSLFDSIELDTAN